MARPVVLFVEVNDYFPSIRAIGHGTVVFGTDHPCVGSGDFIVYTTDVILMDDDGFETKNTIYQLKKETQ